MGLGPRGPRGGGHPGAGPEGGGSWSRAGCRGSSQEDAGASTDGQGLTGLLAPPAAGFTGQNCEENIDDCPGNSCKNGGACVDGVNTYNCRCPPEWTGAHAGERPPPDTVPAQGARSGKGGVTRGSPCPRPGGRGPRPTISSSVRVACGPPGRAAPQSGPLGFGQAGDGGQAWAPPEHQCPQQSDGGQGPAGPGGRGQQGYSGPGCGGWRSLPGKASRGRWPPGPVVEA